MSRYFNKKLSALTPYTPGEQPGDSDSFIKLNTNESPYSPSPEALRYAAGAMRDLRLYPDPEGLKLREALSEIYRVTPESIILGNGSDEILFMAMTAFGDEAVFPDITYGFYPVFAMLCGAEYTEVPLDDDFSVRAGDYQGVPGTLFLANPNAPTGKLLTRGEIEEIVLMRPDYVTIVDEAYIDFGGESAAPLTAQYDRILITGTFSKSRSLAGARVGFAIGDESLIRDLNTVRNSLNPYNVGSPALALALGVLNDEERVRENCRKIIGTREHTARALRELGFRVIPSKANFIMAMHPHIEGAELYSELKKRGVLVRHFDRERIKDYVRISIGLPEEMEILIEKMREITERGARV